MEKRPDHLKIINQDGHTYINSIDVVNGKEKLIGHVEVGHQAGSAEWTAFKHYQCTD